MAYNIMVRHSFHLYLRSMCKKQQKELQKIGYCGLVLTLFSFCIKVQHLSIITLLHFCITSCNYYAGIPEEPPPPPPPVITPTTGVDNSLNYTTFAFTQETVSYAIVHFS